MSKEYANHGAGSAQKSWAFCPSSRVGEQSKTNERRGEGARAHAHGYSVSGYVNGYNPTLPAYPPTRAQLAARAASGGSNVIAPPPGQRFRNATAVWDGPAPRGDPSKPAPGTPYYVNTPKEEAFDSTKEAKDSHIVGGGRLPMMGCDSAVAARGLAVGSTHVRLGNSQDANLTSAGEAIAKYGRDRVFVSAKLSPDEHASVGEALAKILAAAKVGYLDLFSIEWPVQHKRGSAEIDGEGSLEATWAALEKCVNEGSVKALGLANFSVPAVERLMKVAKVKPAVNEVELHPLLAQRKLVGVCRRYGLLVIAHTSLAKGNDALMKHPKLIQACADASNPQTPQALLTRWSLQRGVPIIIENAETLDECVKATTFRLTNAQKVLIDAIEPPPKDGGVRFHRPAFDFTFDDPFLGGVYRPGLDLVPN